MFYIQPPKGLITLHTFEEIVATRLEFLNLVEDDKHHTFNGKFEYLLIGSPYDCIGHFTLRLLTSKSNELFSYWLNKELALLSKRLSVINSRQLYRLFKTILKHLRRREQNTNPVDKVLIDVCLFYQKPMIFKHIACTQHKPECEEFCYKVDFNLIPNLVETRSVELSKGSATIYCSQWKELLQSLFQTFITLELTSQKLVMHQFLADPRLASIQKQLYSYFSTKNYSFGTITSSNIDEEVFNFPPCMGHLHFQLRNKHRLSHYARLYYTLFLKECGMSLEESLIYWRTEYSKPHSCTSLCVHDWQKDAKKFTYSIRHMYGLEGGRKDYKTPDCGSICEQVPGATYEGGCPFANFDKESLNNLLRKLMTENELDEFVKNIAQLKPQEACSRFFKLKSADTIDAITITKPVQYYKKMIEFN